MDCTKPILNVPSENIPQPEDTMPAPDEEDGLDDSDVPIQSVINNIIHKTVPKGYAISPNGSIEANTEAEGFSDRETAGNDGVDKDFGRGKRKCMPNSRYSASTFWRHDDSDNEMAC